MKKPIIRKSIFILFFITINCFAYARIYVSVQGSGNGSGSSWSNASTLENAIAAAPSNTDIWVKAGNYIVNSTLLCERSGLSIYGGFTGNETALNQRDWKNNITTLDGQGTVKIMRFVSNNGIIDGIHFVNGYVTGTAHEINDGGGALRLAGKNQIVRNCSFIDNISNSERGAGAIFIWFGENQLIENCLFRNNSQSYSTYANGGGAIHNWDKNVTIKNCQFIDNSSTNSGGALYTWGDNITVENCLFENNKSTTSGGAIYVSGNTTNIVNCLFKNNSTDKMGGAISNRETLSITNSTFVSNTNTAVSFSGYNCILQIYNSIFFDNSSKDSHLKDVDGDYADENETDYRNNIFEENTLGEHNLVGVDPLFVNVEGGDFTPKAFSPAHDFGDNNLYNQVATTALSESTDLANKPRLFGTNIDAGAYEIQQILSTEDTSTDQAVSVFPNPTTDLLNITSKTANFTKMEVFTILGQRLMERPINFLSSSTITIDISSLSSGIYLLKLSNSKSQKTYRIVKK